MAFKNLGIGNVIRALILEGCSNDEICKRLAKRADAAKFETVLSNRSSHLGWYRADVKKNAAKRAERAKQLSELKLTPDQMKKLEQLGVKL